MTSPLLLLIALFTIDGLDAVRAPRHLDRHGAISRAAGHGSSAAPAARPTTSAQHSEDHFDPDDAGLLPNAADTKPTTSPLPAEAIRAHSDPLLDGRHRPPEALR